MTCARQGLAFGAALGALLMPSVVLGQTAEGQMADETGGVAMELAVKAVVWLSSHANGILVTAYERAPVLVTVLAALLILPVTALAALLAQSMRARHANRLKPAMTLPPRAAVQPLAWLRGPTGHRMALPPALALVRIGRHDDNDIRLDQSTVHRHHALIHRTPTADFIITDVSGQAGNGVVVNGQRLAETRLKSGDTIYLGEAALIFESTLPAYLSQHLPVTVTEASTPKTTTSRIITSPIITAQPTTSPVSQTPSHGR